MEDFRSHAGSTLIHEHCVLEDHVIPTRAPLTLLVTSLVQVFHGWTCAGYSKQSR